MLALRVALNTASGPALCFTALAETAIAPTPEVALRPFLLTSKSIVVYIRKYPRDLIRVTSGVAIDDETSKDVENDAIWLYAAGGNGYNSDTGSSTAAIVSTLRWPWEYVTKNTTAT